MYNVLIASPIPTWKKKQRKSTYFFPHQLNFNHNHMKSVNLLWLEITARSVGSSLVQDPAPKLPAFSAISSALFRF